MLRLNNDARGVANGRINNAKVITEPIERIIQALIPFGIRSLVLAPRFWLVKVVIAEPKALLGKLTNFSIFCATPTPATTAVSKRFI